ncbi:MAG: cyclomaltodextrinase [Eggerthellaceae bacterium]|nr:cyclomaltodextrinase [Eggerthellaceae bacterium]
MNWYENAVVYQIYPLGLTGAPHENDPVVEHRLLQLVDNGWVSHAARLGATCVILNPVFECLSHGYDTTDYLRVDCRLGTNDDLRRVVDAFHEAGVKVLVDTVFNHVGREFWAFRDVREKREASPYASWFKIDWNGDNRFADGFSYACWEGVDELVELNHHDFGLNEYCVGVVRQWESEFDIDGLRLDVAYCLEPGFLGYLRDVCDELSAKRGQKFLMLGETMFGDYNRWMGERACDTVTNYECYKGLWSAMNELNMHEIAYALNRQSGRDPWCLYTGAHLLNFVDNHDVARIATQLAEPRQLEPLYGLLFGMCGVPSIYYGSEWGARGEKLPGDHELRPAFAHPEWNDLTDYVCALAHVKRESEALTQGGYRELLVQPALLVFEREAPGERVVVAVNAGADAQTVAFDARCSQLRDLVTGESLPFEGALELPPFSCQLLQCR